MAVNIKSIGYNNDIITSPIRQQLANTREARIQSIDREITAIENSVNARNNVISTYNQIIGNNNQLIRLHQEQRQALVESKELNQKRIANNNIIIEAAETLLARRQARRTASVEPQSTVSSTAKLPDIDEKSYKVSPLDTAFIADKKQEEEIKNLLPQATLLKEQSAKLEENAKKYELAIEYKEKEIAKLSDSIEGVKDVTRTSSTNTQNSRREGVSTNYTPPANYVPSFNTILKSNDEYFDFNRFTEEQRKYIAQSQANIYESIITSNIRKLI